MLITARQIARGEVALERWRDARFHGGPQFFPNPMPSRSSFFLSVIPLVLAAAAALVEDEPTDLTQARSAFQRDIEFATRPIRDRYITRLETVKRTLGSRGDARGAAAVQDEIDRVRASAPDPAFARYVGAWKVLFANGETRQYVIAPEGVVNYTEQSGRKLSPPVKGRLLVKGADCLLDFQDGGIQRVRVVGKTLSVEQYAAKDGSPDGPLIAKGTGTPGGSVRE